ncbi:MAG: hypothetical protein JSS12_05845 [Verrucomicrobia bacterium]|nr:hypothetical protein [Verrucomicrobiota bacterium]
MSVQEAQLVTVRQFCERFTYPSESAMRAIILDSSINGFDKAIFRVGRRVLVNVPTFFQIIQEKNGGKQL